MKNTVKDILDNLILQYPCLRESGDNLIQGFDVIRKTYQQSGKLLICGNGGSAADADHIVGELMKGFKKKRPLQPEIREALIREGIDLDSVNSLQGALPAINLSAHIALMTASINDINGEFVYAQQVIGYGRGSDALLGISTSGNSNNILSAIRTAKALGLKTIGLTGAHGGELSKICDVIIKVPEKETYKIQELHLPIYHALCAMVEEEFFEE